LWYSTTSTQEKNLQNQLDMLVGHHMQIKHARHKKKNISIEIAKESRKPKTMQNYARNLGIDGSAKENFKINPALQPNSVSRIYFKTN